LFDVSGLLGCISVTVSFNAGIQSIQYRKDKSGLTDCYEYSIYIYFPNPIASLAAFDYFSVYHDSNPEDRSPGSAWHSLE
jgi:hypothetical protein